MSERTTVPARGGTEPAGRGPLAARMDAGLDAWARLARECAAEPLRSRVSAAGQAVLDTLLAGGKILVAGNGGSAAMSGHVAAEFVGRCVHDRRPLPAMSLADSTAAVTAVGNDYGFEEVFARGVAAFGTDADLLLVMSTSGSSPNVVRALDVARAKGLRTILMTGAATTVVDDVADHVLVVPSHETPRIQEVHLLWAHGWCEAVDEILRDQR